MLPFQSGNSIAHYSYTQLNWLFFLYCNQVHYVKRFCFKYRCASSCKYFRYLHKTNSMIFTFLPPSSEQNSISSTSNGWVNFLAVLISIISKIYIIANKFIIKIYNAKIVQYIAKSRLHRSKVVVNVFKYWYWEKKERWSQYIFVWGFVPDKVLMEWKNVFCQCPVG